MNDLKVQLFTTFASQEFNQNFGNLIKLISTPRSLLEFIKQVQLKRKYEPLLKLLLKQKKLSFYLMSGIKLGLISCEDFTSRQIKKNPSNIIAKNGQQDWEIRITKKYGLEEFAFFGQFYFPFILRRFCEDKYIHEIFKVAIRLGTFTFANVMGAFKFIENDKLLLKMHYLIENRYIQFAQKIQAQKEVIQLQQEAIFERAKPKKVVKKETTKPLEPKKEKKEEKQKKKQLQSVEQQEAYQSEDDLQRDIEQTKRLLVDDKEQYFYLQLNHRILISDLQKEAIINYVGNSFGKEAKQFLSELYSNKLKLNISFSSILSKVGIPQLTQLKISSLLCVKDDVIPSNWQHILIEKIQNQQFSKWLTNKYSSNHCLILQILRLHPYIDEKTISDTSNLSLKDSRSILLQLYSFGYIEQNFCKDARQTICIYTYSQRIVNQKMQEYYLVTLRNLIILIDKLNTKLQIHRKSDNLDEMNRVSEQIEKLEKAQLELLTEYLLYIEFKQE